MIAASRPVALFSLAAAGALHVVLIMGVAAPSPPKPEIDGGAGALEARIGSSFADMTAGAQRAAPPVTTHAPDMPTQTAPATTPRAAPQTAQAQSTAMVPHVPRHAARAADSTVAAAPAPVTGADRPIAPTRPQKDVQPAAKPKTLVAEDGAPPAPARSLRPQTRSADFERRYKPDDPPGHEAAPRAQPGQKPKESTRGNAQRSTRAGATTGHEKAAARQQGRANTAATRSGNAAASNYPGQVMKRISGVPRPRVASRGTAVVSFTIAPGGGLGAVSLAQSSGSGELDRAALRVIRRAAPFPAPPPGARRTYSIHIQGG